MVIMYLCDLNRVSQKPYEGKSQIRTIENFEIV